MQKEKDPRRAFLQKVNNPWWMRAFLLWKLPAAWFMGIGVASCDENQATVRLPYGWRSQNPFRSTYFAAQCAAGELSTGILALAILQATPPVSMLVVDVKAEFFKKASTTLLFTCEQGKDVANTIQQALQTGQAHTLTMISTGRLPDGAEAARVYITWSFKAKKSND